MDIHVKRVAKGLIITLIGRLDAVSVGELDKEMDEQILRVTALFAKLKSKC